MIPHRGTFKQYRGVGRQGAIKFKTTEKIPSIIKKPPNKWSKLL